MSKPSWSSVLGDNSFVPIAVSANGRALVQDLGIVPNERDKWVVVAPPHIRLHPGIREIVLRHSQPRPDVDLFYGDEVAAGNGRYGHDIILKPALDLALLLADDYVGTPLVVRGSAMHRLGGLRPAANTAASSDLVLRAISAGLGIGRITEVLAVHPGARPRPDPDDRRAVIDGWVAGSRDSFEVSNGLVPGTLQLKRRFVRFPDVTLVIPTRQSINSVIGDSTLNQPFIISCLNSLQCTNWPMDKLHVLVGDAIEDDRIYHKQRWPFCFRRIIVGSACNRKFNYAAKMNTLWRAADTQYLVLMNDDIVVNSPDWLQALLTFAMQEDVGGVGARLLYPNGTLQHAGVPGGLFGVCAHAWLGQSARAPTYQNWALVQREWSMVTGALFATRKSILELVNGFDERFRLEYNDLDLCLRLRMLGYRIVYTPFAELTHYEKASRGDHMPPGSELALFWKRWNEFLKEDPAYHPRLVRNTFQVAPLEQLGEWWE
jgi:Glycosyltransferase like family 2